MSIGQKQLLKEIIIKNKGKKLELIILKKFGMVKKKKKN